MSEAIEVVLRLYDAWNRRDVEAGIALLHPEVELHTSGDFPGMASVYRGRDEALRFYEDLSGPWERLDMVLAEEHDLGGGRVLTLYRFAGVGRGGITVKRDAAQIVAVEDGLVRSMRTFSSWDEARAVAGIGGHPSSAVQ
jgi:ketosteroid isomerase-like protein